MDEIIGIKVYPDEEIKESYVKAFIDEEVIYEGPFASLPINPRISCILVHPKDYARIEKLADG